DALPDDRRVARRLTRYIAAVVKQRARQLTRCTTTDALYDDRRVVRQLTRCTTTDALYDN
ncbi:hypothetical protein, partial [Kribbella sp. DT2]|uniref:hypothetical protein n=1 Tax=Kribbella sp. DT2 TaxID=3393427 RepID=UPI003CEEA373